MDPTVSALAFTRKLTGYDISQNEGRGKWSAHVASLGEAVEVIDRSLQRLGNPLCQCPV